MDYCNECKYCSLFSRIFEIDDPSIWKCKAYGVLKDGYRISSYKNKYKREWCDRVRVGDKAEQCPEFKYSLPMRIKNHFIRRK